MEAESAAFTKGAKESVNAMHEMRDAAESLQHVVEGAFAFVGVEAGVGAIKEMVGHTMEATAEAYRLSGALGITTGSLQSLQTAGLLGAGMQADEFNGVLNKLVKSLGSAEGGAGPAAEALAKLGLSGKELQGMHVDDAFIKIAQSISEVKDPLEQGHLAVELFGKEGQKLLPMFKGGAAGIAEAAEQAKRFGVALSDTDAAKVMAANESFEKMNLAITGVENQLTVALAPVLEEIVNRIISVAPAADQMRTGIMTALKYVAEGVGFVGDAWNGMQLVAQAVSYEIVADIELITLSVQKIAEGIVWVINKLGGHAGVPAWITDTQSAVDAWRNQIGSDMRDTVDKLASPNAAKWGAFFDDIQGKAADAAAKMADGKHSMAGAITDDFEENGKKIQGILAGLAEQVATFGMSEEEKKLAQLKGGTPQEQAKGKALVDQLETMKKQQDVAKDLASLARQAAQFGETEAQKKMDDLKDKGATSDQLGQAAKLNDQIEKMSAWKKEQEEANKLIEESMTPIDKYQQQIDKVQKLFKDGLITAQQQSDAIKKAGDDLKKANDKDDPGSDKHAAAATRRFDFKIPGNPGAGDTGKQQLQAQKQLLQQAQQQTDYLADMWRFANNADQASEEVIDF